MTLSIDKPTTSGYGKQFDPIAASENLASTAEYDQPVTVQNLGNVAVHDTPLTLEQRERGYQGTTHSFFNPSIILGDAR